MLINIYKQFTKHIANYILFCIFTLSVLFSSNAYSDKNNSALATACRSDNTMLISTLLKSGANPGLLTIDQLLLCSDTDEEKILDSIRKKVSKNNRLTSVSSLWKIYSHCNGNNLPVGQDYESYIYSLEAKIDRLLSLGIDINSTDHKGRNALFVASRSCPTSVVSSIIKLGADINHLDNNKQTPLIHAAGWNELAVIKLLSNKININLVDKYGNSALHKASESNIDAVVQLLLISGANVNAVNTDGMTPLMLAARTGATDIVTLLINANSKVDVASTIGNTALILAVTNNHIDVIQILVNAGAIINVSNNEGKTALTIATGYKNSKVVNLLLSGGGTVPIEKIKVTWLEALKTGNVEAIKLWLPHSPDMQLKNKSGESILHWESVIKNGELIKLLLDSGAVATDLNVRKEIVLQHYLKVRWGYKTKKNKKSKTIRNTTFNSKTVELLAKSGTSVINNVDDKGHTALFSIFSNDTIKRLKQKNIEKIIISLVDAGADINAVNGDGRSILQVAPMKLTGLLIRLGLTVNIVDSEGVSDLMHLISKVGNYGSSVFNAVYDLISAGADVNHKTNDGTTVLMKTVESRNISVLEAILAAGADINVRDSKGRTAWHRAIGLDEYRLFIILLGENPDMTKEERSEVEQYLQLNQYKMQVREFVKNKSSKRIIVKVDTFDKVLYSPYPEDLEFLLKFSQGLYSQERLNHAFYQYMSSSNRYEETLSILRKHGGNINAIGSDGKNPLSTALDNNWSKEAKQLLRAGANVDVNDSDGKPLINKRNISKYTIEALNKEQQEVDSKCGTEKNTSSRYLEYEDFILDVKNNIIWKRCPEGMKGSTCTGVAKLHVKSDATFIAANMEYSGKNDWRLPSSTELKSLYDIDCSSSKKTISQQVFKDIPVKGYWASGHPERKPEAHNFVDLKNGRINDYTYKYQYSSNWALQRVWLVHDWLDTELSK